MKFEDEPPDVRHARDRSIPCPRCFAETGHDCATTSGLVHIERRIKRLLIERRPDLLEEPS